MMKKVFIKTRSYREDYEEDEFCGDEVIQRRRHYGNDYYVYCPNCKEAKHEQSCTLVDTILDKYGAAKNLFQCDSCGTVYVQGQDCVVVNEAAYREFAYANVFVDGPKVKLSLGLKFYTFFNGKIQIKNYTNRIVFNTENGRTYILQPWLNRKKPTEKECTFYKIEPMKQKARNISYGEGILGEFKLVPHETIHELASTLFAILSDKVGFNVSRQFSSAEITLRNLCLINRFPSINRDGLITWGSFRNTLGGKIPRKVAAIKSDEDFYQKFCKAYKVSDKFLQGVVRKNLVTMKRIDEYKHVFTSLDLIKELIEQGGHFLDSSDSIQPDAYYKFVKTGINATSEAVMARKMLAVDGKDLELGRHYLCDSAKMYWNILSEIPNFKMKWSGTIKEIHNYLDLTQRKLSIPLLPLRYTDKELELEEICGSYEFRFIKDTHEMINLGNAMNMCVGGYGWSAFMRECNIMALYCDGYPIVCIELNGTTRYIRQTKLHSNDRPEDPIKYIILDWMEKHNLKMATYDLGFDISDESMFNFDGLHDAGKMHPDTLVEFGLPVNDDDTIGLNTLELKSYIKQYFYNKDQEMVELAPAEAIGGDLPF